MNIVFPDSKTLSIDGDIDLKSIFEKYGNVTLYDAAKENELPEIFKDADIILCNKTPMNEKSLNASKVKYIGVTATGYNNIDLEYTNKRNIIVCNAAGYSTDSVAQHTFAMILNIYNQISNYNNFTKDDGWKNSETFSPFVYPMYELKGKTMGIIGFGTIGRRVADIALAFGLKVLVFSRNEKKVKEVLKEFYNEYYNGEKNENSDIDYASLDEINKKSDIISFHCPLNKDSEGIIDKNFLNNCKRNAVIINTARGGLVVEKDLKWALENDIIAAAALDVISKEPMDKESILPGTKNLIITPHVAWAPYETRKRLVDMVEENLAAFLDGKPKNVIK